MAFVSNSQFCDDIDRLIREEDKFGSSGSESGEESSSNPKPRAIAAPSSSEPRKKRPYQRYTADQIKRLQEVFDATPHPDEEERCALGEELGLDTLRVKFWFQNRRSQTKKKNDKDLNSQLKEENEKLRTDNEIYKLTLASAACRSCGALSPGEMSASVELLRAENDAIKEEIFKVTSFVEKYCGKGVLSLALNPANSSAGPPEEPDAEPPAAQPADVNDNMAGEIFGWSDDQVHA